MIQFYLIKEIIIVINYKFYLCLGLYPFIITMIILYLISIITNSKNIIKKFQKFVYK